MEENDQHKAAERLARRAAETDDAKEREEIRSRVAMLVGGEEQRRLWHRYLVEGGD
jgi:mitochondrial fission protein ELM1